MAAAQLTYRDSLGDIETCLRVQHTNLYHLNWGASGQTKESFSAYEGL